MLIIRVQRSNKLINLLRNVLILTKRLRRLRLLGRISLEGFLKGGDLWAWVWA